MNEKSVQSVQESKQFNYPVVDMESTGKKIKALLEERNITPNEVKDILGLGSLQAVYKWFSGKSIPSIDNLGVLAKLLDTPIDDIVVFRNR